MNKRALGRGLQALLPNITDKTDEKEKIIEIPLTKILISRKQPRHTFNEEKLNELALSIKEHGVVQPIIVRAVEGGKYELVAGERRWRACKLLGIEKIPALIRNVTEKETSEISLIENIQREDLNPIEEATAYKTLMEEYKLTQEEVSKRVGKSRSFIANAVRLLNLPEQVRTMVNQGVITAGHARALIALPEGKEQEEIAKKIVLKELSVRQAERVVRNIVEKKEEKKKKSSKRDPAVQELEEKLIKRFSTKVIIRHTERKGKIEIEYYGEEELQRLLEMLLEEKER